MKTILVPVDFSIPSENAARYALHFGKILNSEIFLCNAYPVPAEAVGSAQIAWPLYDRTTLKAMNQEELEHLAKRLMNSEVFSNPDALHSSISCATCPGETTEVIREFAIANKAGMIIMGMSGAGAVTRFFMGSVVRETLDKVEYPLVLVPSEYAFRGINKIAFASDFNSSDIDVIQSLIPLASRFDAQLVIIHVTEEPEDNAEYIKESALFLKKVTNSIDYDKVYCRHIYNLDTDSGLDWLTNQHDIDLLVMVHQRQGLLAEIFNDSHTKKLLTHINVPLLVFPSGKQFTF